MYAMRSSGVSAAPAHGISRHTRCIEGSGSHIAAIIASRISFLTSSRVVWFFVQLSSMRLPRQYFFSSLCFSLPIYFERYSFLWNYNNTVNLGENDEACRKKQRPAKKQVSASATIIVIPRLGYPAHSLPCVAPLEGVFSTSLKSQ